jgi:glutamine synthetase
MSTGGRKARRGTVTKGSAVTDIEQLQRDLRAQGVKYVFGAYTDVHGVPKSKCVPLEHLADAVAGSELYTVGALDGMGELGPNEDECAGIPDLDELTVLPWDKRYAVAPANLLFHGEPYPFDFRRLLQNQADDAASLGYRMNMGVEPEVYVLRETGDGPQPWVAEDLVNAPTRGYDLETTVLAGGFLESMVGYMNELGWDVYSFDHEGGDGQYEFDFGYTDAVQMADRMLVFRLMAKHVARTLGCFASFMPKPFQDGFGSGAHLNVSLVDLATGKNAFDGGSGGPVGPGAADLVAVARDNAYSPVAYQFTAGVLEHGAALMAVLSPTVNSYKRLMPRGLMQEISWAPVFQAWGYNNRTLMCRLPINRRCLEVRSADSAVNFYLATALVLAAGLDGIRRELRPPDPVNTDTYKMTEAELATLGVRRLPWTLGEAVTAFEESEFVPKVLGSELHAFYARLKREEWQEYNTVVSEWELKRYLRLW